MCFLIISRKSTNYKMYYYIFGDTFYTCENSLICEIVSKLSLSSWSITLSVLMSFGFILSTLYTALTEEKKVSSQESEVETKKPSFQCLKEVRSKVETSWNSLLNLIYSIRLSQELEKRKRILEIEKIKNDLREASSPLTPSDIDVKTPKSGIFKKGKKNK